MDRVSSGAREQLRNAQHTTSIAGQLLRLSLKGLLLSSIAVLAMEFIESLLRDPINSVFPPLLHMSSNSGNFIELIGQIGATFLSIYFATFGIILSSRYTSARHDVINLLLREKVNNIYSSFLIYLTVLCLLSSALGYLGYETGYFVFVVVAIGGLIAVLCLFELGKRLFLFFDASRLVQSEIVPELVRLIDEVAASDGASVHLDNHRRVLASRLLETMQHLRDVANRLARKKTLPAANIEANYASLLDYYVAEKTKIQRESYWFRRVQRHPDWFLENDSATSMAIETDMHLTPKEEIDARWFECELLDGLVSSFGESLSNSDLSSANKTLSCFQIALEALAKAQLIEPALDTISRLREHVSNRSLEPKLPLDGVTLAPTIEQLALHEGVARASAVFSIEYLRSSILFAQNVQKLVCSINWKKGTFEGIPASVVDQLQIAQKRIAFEEKVEGKRLTSDNYIVQLVVRDFVQSIENNIELVLEDLRKSTILAVTENIARKQEALATLILLSSFRTATQTGIFLEKLAPEISKLKELEVYPEYAIPDLDLNSSIKKLTDLREQLLELMVSPEILIHVSTQASEDGKLPDYFGQCYFMLAEECFGSLEDNNPTKFEKLFPAFFALGDIAFSRFGAKKDEVGPEYYVSLLASIAEDLLAITGFALVYGEFHTEDRFAEFVRQTWNRKLEAAEDKQAYLRWLIAVYAIIDDSFTATPRDLTRTRWSMRFEATLREAGYSDRLSFSRMDQQHPSPLVQTVSGIGLHKASQAAAYLVLVSHIEGEIDLPRGIQNFRDSFLRAGGQA